MRGNENYQDIQKKISLFIDNELDNCDCENLKNKISSDPKCKKIFNKEKKFRDYIKYHIKRPSVSSTLVTNIKNSIALDG